MICWFRSSVGSTTTQSRSAIPTTAPGGRFRTSRAPRSAVSACKSITADAHTQLLAAGLERVASWSDNLQVAWIFQVEAIAVTVAERAAVERDAPHARFAGCHFAPQVHLAKRQAVQNFSELPDEPEHAATSLIRLRRV